MKKVLTVEERDRLLLEAGKEFAKTYMLMTDAIDHAESGELAVEKLGMYRTDIKRDAVRVMKAFDIFFNNFKKYLSKGDGKVILEDYERVKGEIDKILEEKL